MIKKCLGCGITLQNTDKDKLGYVPSNNNDDKYCERCFKMKNYNQNLLVELPIDQDSIIEQINKNADLVYYLIDFLNLNEETISYFNKIKKDKILLISKTDVLPKSFKENKIIDWIKETYKISDQVILISSKIKYNISKITNKLENMNGNVYFLGYTNSGKSTLLNTITKKLEIDKTEIVESITPNTTLDFIEIVINENLTIFDSPGFTMRQSVFNFNDTKLLKKLNIKKSLKPITQQNKDNISYTIEDVLSLNCISKKNSLTFYMSNNINIVKEFKKREFESKRNIVIDENQDLVIKGLGFINIKNKCIIEIDENQKDLIEVRNSLF